MLKKDNIWLGLALGLILPGTAFIIVEILKRKINLLEKEDLLYIGCAALNLTLFRYYFNQKKDQTARGVISATFICAFIFFIYKVSQ